MKTDIPIAPFFIVTLFLLAACGQPAADTSGLQNQIDSLQRKLDNA